MVVCACVKVKKWRQLTVSPLAIIKRKYTYIIYVYMPFLKHDIVLLLDMYVGIYTADTSLRMIYN